MKKRTARYCSVRCCTLDPERRERLRAHARRAQQPLPMARQLSMTLPQPAFDPEAQLASFGVGREDVPGGMSRLVG